MSAVVAMAAVMVFGVVVSAQTAGEEAVAVKVTGVNVCLLGTYAPGAEAVAGMEKVEIEIQLMVAVVAVVATLKLLLMLVYLLDKL